MCVCVVVEESVPTAHAVPAGCWTLSRETVDGQKIAPPHHGFLVFMLQRAFQDAAPPPLPPVLNVVKLVCLIVFVIVLALDHLIAEPPFNINFGGCGRFGVAS